MHSIERYGIVALLFLVVTVVAVLMWDGGKAQKEKRVATGVPAPVVAPRATEPETTQMEAADPARRLSLSAPSEPGPLFRDPPARAAEDASASQESTSPAPDADAAADAGGLAPESLRPGSEPPRTHTPREQTVHDDPIAATNAPVNGPVTTHAYTVRAGDTLSEIAQRELGSSRRWQELVAANPGLDPAKLHVGKRIQVPGATAAVAASSARDTARVKPAASARKEGAAPAGKTWKVGKGESLWKIAERALGNGKRWGEIVALNPGLNPDKLVQGQILKLPGAATTTASVRTGPVQTGSLQPKSAPPKKAPATTLVASAPTSERSIRRGDKVAGGKVK